MPSRDIETITAHLRVRFPRIQVQQLIVAHPGADDDGIWFFSHPGLPFEVQLESASGTFPFLVETDRHSDRAHVADPAQASDLIATWLGLSE